MSLADTPTPKAQAGTWTLTAPDGRTWTADSPIKCVATELRERVPAVVAMARIEREIRAGQETGVAYADGNCVHGNSTDNECANCDALNR